MKILQKHKSLTWNTPDQEGLQWGCHLFVCFVSMGGWAGRPRSLGFWAVVLSVQTQQRTCFFSKNWCLEDPSVFLHDKVFPSMQVHLFPASFSLYFIRVLALLNFSSVEKFILFTDLLDKGSPAITFLISERNYHVVVCFFFIRDTSLEVMQEWKSPDSLPVMNKTI